MPDLNSNPQMDEGSHEIPELRRNAVEPKGVLQKNLKLFLYLGAALLVIIAAIFSSSGKKTPSGQAAKGVPPQPNVQDNTDNNVQDLKNQVAAERLKEQQATTTAAIRLAIPRLLTLHPPNRQRRQHTAPTVNRLLAFPASRALKVRMGSKTTPSRS
jgi:hypothetical protein